MSIRKASFVVAFVAVMAFAGSASAQDKSSWAVQASTTPKWEMLPALEVLFGTDADLSGSDITVGISRGSMSGGEWGASLVRKNFDGSSKIEDLGTQCFGSQGQFCYPKGKAYELHSVHMTGVEAYRFVPFVRVNRVQIGMTFAGGVAKMSGRVTKRSYDPVVVSQTPTSIVINPRETVREVSVADTLADLGVSEVFPLGRIEATVAVRVTSHLKVRAGGGFNFPGTAKIGVGATYLF